MVTHTLRVRIDRRTGKEISSQIVDTHEISADEYAKKIVWFLTGKTPETVADEILSEVSQTAIT